MSVIKYKKIDKISGKILKIHSKYIPNTFQITIGDGRTPYGRISAEQGLCKNGQVK